MQVTHRGVEGRANMTGVSRERFPSEVPVTDSAHSWRGVLISSQVVTVVTLVRWSGSLTGSECDLWYSQA